MLLVDESSFPADLFRYQEAWAMHNSRARSWIVTALIVGTVIALPGAAARTARTHTAHVAQQGSCAVPGTYRIGPRVLPLAGAARGRASVQTPVAGAVTAGAGGGRAAPALSGPRRPPARAPRGGAGGGSGALPGAPP